MSVTLQTGSSNILPACSYDLTACLSSVGWDQTEYQTEVSMYIVGYIHYEDTKYSAKYRNWGWLGVNKGNLTI